MAYTPLAKDFVNALVHITEKYVRNRAGEFKIVSELSVFLGRLDALQSLDAQLCLYPIREVCSELQDYLDRNSDAVTDLFPTLKEPINKFFESNPYNCRQEFEQHLEFELKQKNDMERALKEAFLPVE